MTLPTRISKEVDATETMIERTQERFGLKPGHIFEIGFMEKAVLPTSSLTHHRRNPLAEPETQGNHVESQRSKDLFNSLGHEPTFQESPHGVRFPVIAGHFDSPCPVPVGKQIRKQVGSDSRFCANPEVGS